VAHYRQLTGLLYRNRLPIGPIGAHLSLEDTRWAKAAEVALGAHLNKWICHNVKDAQVGAGSGQERRQLAATLYESACFYVDTMH
jgi:chromosome segregation ATPase